MEITLLPFTATDESISVLADGSAAVGWLDSKSGAMAQEIDQVMLSGKNKNQKKLPYLSLRKEEWGGLLIDGRNARIFQLGPKAYTVMSEIIHNDTEKQEAVQISDNEKEEIISEFKSYDLIP